MQTIQCQNCNHVWNTPYKSHCKCPACGREVQIPGAVAFYQRNAAARLAVPGGLRGAAPSPLPPEVRGSDGQPLPKPESAHNRDDGKPRYVADDYSFIKRRQEQLKREAEIRVAGDQKREIDF